jgi:succinate dehydrogenase / fumarate reductase cytochrome b subunit
MVLFVIAHVAGNSTIFFNALNSYAAHLHALPLLLWLSRGFMAAALALHVVYGVILTLENSAARPQKYIKTRHLESSIASRTMIWTGLLIAAFLVYHLLQFTIQVTDPATSALRNPDSLGRPDVTMMVLKSFEVRNIASAYVLAMIALGLHLLHGIQSSVQTWGLNSDRSFPFVTTGGKTVAVALFLAYIAIPVVIVIGLLR